MKICFCKKYILSSIVLPIDSHTTPMDHFFPVLVKLHLDLQFPRYGISICSEFGYNHQNFIMAGDYEYVRLKFLITWPSREILSENMPQVFKLTSFQASAM